MIHTESTFQPTTASLVRRKVDRIFQATCQHRNDSIGLLSGRMSKALFCYYYGQITQNQTASERGWSFIAEAFDRIAEGGLHFSHCNGMAGFGWGLEHLAEQGFIDLDVNDALKNMDDYLGEIMIAEMQAGNFDFLHGSAGIALYFLKRRKWRPRKADQYLQKWMQVLRDTAEEGPEGTLKWKALTDYKKNEYGYQINLSHGIMSIVAVLSKIYAAGAHQRTAFELADRACRYVLQQRIDQDYRSMHVFPAVAIESLKDGEMGTRLAWCYGDLGIGLALRNAGKNLGQESWIDIADYVLVKTTKRRTPEDTMVRDACMCHGTAGNGHIYQRLWLQTRNPLFKEAADYWLDETLHIDSFKNGLAGYRTYMPEDMGGWTKTSDMIEGTSGIGLALLSKLKEYNPAWDEAFLMS